MNSGLSNKTRHRANDPLGGGLMVTSTAPPFVRKFRRKSPTNGIGIVFHTENRNGIDLNHLQNSGKFFTFSR